LIANRFSTIILAGGHSSRMGRDKALIEIQGVPMVRRVYDAARTVSDVVYVVTPRVEQYRSLLPSDTKFIAEVEPQGPTIAFSQALIHVSTEWVLLLACDLPQLEGTMLSEWATMLDQVALEAVALLPKHEKGWEPLCGFYRSTCLAGLQQFIEQGGRSFQAWLATQRVQELPIRDSFMLFNCNTPSDLEQVSQNL
jgi:molybdopterin-guanine dinucleotide biosynthesis protein A